MGTIGMPIIEITFAQKAVKETKKQEQGTVALILREELKGEQKRNFEVLPDDEVEKLSLSETNKEQIKLALMGNNKRPKKAICYLIGAEEDYTEALNWLEVQRFQYIAVPTVETDGKAKVIADWIEKQRKRKKIFKAVLPNYVADSEFIINYATEKVYKNDVSYTTEQYCARIAGLLAGTDLKSSCTYAVLEELTDCTSLSEEQMNEAIGEGKLIVYHDGEKVKVVRGVNSLTTETDTKGRQFKKIKIVEAMDAITESVKKTIQDKYIGKMPNSFDNKCLLISEIQDYYTELMKEEIIAQASIEIDTEATKKYLESIKIDTSEMTEEEIKKAETDEKVFLKSKIKIYDVMEEITLPIEV